MPFCSIRWCGNNDVTSSATKDGISFHRFPKIPEIKERWAEATHRPGFIPRERSVICSRHFTPDCFDKSKSIRRLFHTAVPTLFLPILGSAEEIAELKKDTVPSSSHKVFILESANNTSGIKIECQDDENVESPIQQYIQSNAINGVSQTVDTYAIKPEQPPAAHAQDNSCLDADVPLTELTPRERTMKRKIDHLTYSLEQKKKDVKSLRDKNRFLTKTRPQINEPKKKMIANVKDIIKALKDKFYISYEVEYLLDSIEVGDGELQQKIPKSKAGDAQSYSNELRSFALTLHFYTPKGYIFVKNTYATCLPPSSVVRKWYQTDEGKPGFSKEAIHIMKRKARESEEKVYATLVFDDMSLKGNVEYDYKEKVYYGYVDYGTVLETDLQDEARDALVFYLVAINASWKIPIGYFLIRKINCEQKLELLTEAIHLVEEAGIHVRAVSFDVSPPNIAVAKKLGCAFDYKKFIFESVFKSPCSDTQIAAFLDPTRMIEKVRNAFELYKKFEDKNGDVVSWHHLVQLHNTPVADNVDLKDRLKAANLFLKSKIVKIEDDNKIIYKKCIPDATTDENLNRTDVGPTVRFLEVLCDLFDILDSHINGKDFKQAINIENAEIVLSILTEAKDALLNLSTEITTDEGIGVQSKKHVALLESPFYTGFMGLCMCIESATFLIGDLVLNPSDPIPYLPFHKMSLDHLERVFASIRCVNGVKYEPTARQFQTFYKQLIKNTDNIDLYQLSVLPSPIERINASSRYKDIMKDEEDEMDSLDTSFDSYLKAEPDCSEFEGLIHVSEFGEKVIEYMATFTIQALIKEIKCQTCVGALIGMTNLDKQLYKKDAKYKLFSGSNSVIEICRRCEVYIKRAMSETNGTGKVKALPPKYNTEYFTRKVSKYLIGCDIFSEINYHQFEIESVNHLIELARCVVRKYSEARLSYLTRNDPMTFSRKIRADLFDFL